jgi:3-deoxy-D-manno-octulosonate 8-phosphate phosphatase KdsC-like HAD superfamily phosphatase
MAKQETIQEQVIEELIEMKRLGMGGTEKALRTARDSQAFESFIEDLDIDPTFFGSRDISNICDFLR